MTARVLLLSLTFTLCDGAARADDKKPDAPKPPTEEQIKAWLKKLEEPTRSTRDPKPGPPDNGVGPDFDFRIHDEALFVAKCGESVRKEIFAIVNDPMKSSQTRAHAAIVLVEWLKGKGAKQVPDAKVLEALKEGLQGKDRAVKWAILHWANRYGAAANLSSLVYISEEEHLKLYGVSRDSLYFSDDAMDGLLPNVIPLLVEEEPLIASSAAGLIASFGRPKQGIKELIAALERREVEIRVAVVFALGRVGNGDPTALKAVVNELNPTRYGGPHSSDYSAVVQMVGWFGPDAKDAVPALITVLKSCEWKRRAQMLPEEETVRTLGNIGPAAKDAVPWLLKYGETCTRDWPRLIAALDKIDPGAAKNARAMEKQLRESNGGTNPNPKRQPESPEGPLRFFFPACAGTGANHP
jgi:hypothetical protein